jgi:hypothetical protein
VPRVGPVADAHLDGDLPVAVSRAPAASAPRLSGGPRWATAAPATPAAMRSLAGRAQAAVARESSKRKIAHFRGACDKRLRDAFCTLAVPATGTPLGADAPLALQWLSLGLGIAVTELQDLGHGQNEDSQVQPQRPVLDVVVIPLHAVGN